MSWREVRSCADPPFVRKTWILETIRYTWNQLGQSGGKWVKGLSHLEEGRGMVWEMTFVPPVVAGCEDRSALTVSAISTAILLPLSRPCAMCRGSTRLCFLRSVIIFNGQDLSAMGLHVCIYIYICVCWIRILSKGVFECKHDLFPLILSRSWQN